MTGTFGGARVYATRLEREGHLMTIVSPTPEAGAPSSDAARLEALFQQAAELAMRLEAPEEFLSQPAHRETFARDLHAVLGDLSAQLASLRVEYARLFEVATNQAGALEAMRASVSWRLTAPVRAATTLAREVARGLATAAKAVLRGPFEAALRLGARHPAAATKVFTMLGRTPVAGPRLIRFAQIRGYVVPHAAEDLVPINVDAAPEAVAFWSQQFAGPRGG